MPGSRLPGRRVRKVGPGALAAVLNKPDFPRVLQAGERAVQAGTAGPVRARKANLSRPGWKGVYNPPPLRGSRRVGLNKNCLPSGSFGTI